MPTSQKSCCFYPTSLASTPLRLASLSIAQADLQSRVSAIPPLNNSCDSIVVDGSTLTCRLSAAARDGLAGDIPYYLRVRYEGTAACSQPDSDCTSPDSFKVSAAPIITAVTAAEGCRPDADTGGVLDCPTAGGVI